MGMQEDIKKMRGEGRTEREIIDNLRKQKISDKDISDALTQVKIKEAVSSSSPESEPSFPVPDTGEVIGGAASAQRDFSASAPSGVATASTQEVPEYPSASADYSAGNVPLYPEQEQQDYYDNAQSAQEYTQPIQTAPGNYPSEAYNAEAYSQYQPYQEAMSSDMITEIAEQVVTEKLAIMQDRLEKAVNFRTVADARISNVNERLKRIEKIIDRLQLSLLQKVGEYMTNVQDLKQELEETQKSFKAATSGRGHHAPHAQTHQHQHPEHLHHEHSHEHAHEHEKKKHP